MKRRITRRDFLDGVALVVGGAAAGTALGGGTAYASTASSPPTPPTPAGGPWPDLYPPALQGMRGSYNGTFEVAHALRDGTFWDHAGTPVPTDRPYDLVVVGAGISGLSAAHFYLRDVDPHARILVLDPHDDFGGHAKRNEFTVNGRTLIGYGGSQSIENPSAYPPEASQIFSDLGIDLTKFETSWFDQNFYARNGVRGRATFFAREQWGTDHLSVGGTGAQIMAGAPLSDADKAKLIEVLDQQLNYLPDLTPDQTVAQLNSMSYGTFLTTAAGVTGDAYRFLLRLFAGNTGVNNDQIGANEAAALGYPGTAGLNLDWDHGPWPGLSKTATRFWGHNDPYIYHFPDGNASIARALVRRLNPKAIPGGTIEDLITARCDYSVLDHDESHPRIRLNTTVVRVQQNTRGGIDVAYVQDGTLYTVRAGNVVMACWNNLIPYIAPDYSDAQKAAGHQAVKYPLIYANVALTNWRAWQRLGVASVAYPEGFWSEADLDFPVSIGDYRFSANPDEPILLHVEATVTQPGTDPQSGAKAGRRQLVTMTFEDMERSIRDSLTRVFGPYGFDPAADIVGLTTNRWSHGYARWYGLPFDKAFWPQGPTPADIVGTPVGRMTVATTDEAYHGFVDGALESAYHAVRYLGSLA